MEFNRVVNGIARYLEKEVYRNMNGLQEFTVRLFAARMLNNSNLESWLMKNPYVRALITADENGNIDVDGLYRDMKAIMQTKGRLEIDNVPLLGKLTFTESDVDCLYNCIMGG